MPVLCKLSILWASWGTLSSPTTFTAAPSYISASLTPSPSVRRVELASLLHACGPTLTSFRASLQPISLPPAVKSFLASIYSTWLSQQVTQRGLKQQTCIFSQFWRLQDPQEGGGGRRFCDSLKGSLSFPRRLACPYRARLQHRSSFSRTCSACPA